MKDIEQTAELVVVDANRYKKVKNALSDSEARYRLLFENMTEGVAVHELQYDENGKPVDYRILDVNRAYEKNTGISHEKAVGHLASNLYGSQKPPYIDEYAAVVLDRKPLFFETYFPPVDKYFSISVFSPKQDQFVTVFQDISERKRLESQKEAALADVRQKAHELLEKNGELERFTYSVSHDLKSPLVTILTFLGHLEQDMAANNNEKIKRAIGYIRNGAEKMSRLLDDLLKLSRIGRIANPVEDLSLQTIVKEALDLVAGQIKARGVKVTVGSSELMLHGDRLRLIEVFQNLLDNACKFMGEQKVPLIEIGAETKNTEDVIYVRDNGMGIEPQFLARLFVMFEKFDRSTEGDGIGLALVKRIIEVHNGRIWVESDGPGQGTTFRFTLQKK